MATRRELAGNAAAAAALLLTTMMPIPAYADAAAGERLARQWCVNCHVVPGGAAGTTLPQGPPSFSAIAEHLDAGALHAFLSHPHKPMPDLALSRAEIDNLVDYIETLKK